MRRAWTAAVIGLTLASCVGLPPEPEATSAPSPPAEKPSEPPASSEVSEANAPVERDIVVLRAEPQPNARGSEDVDRLLSYFEQIRKLPAAELSRENETARTAFSRTRSDFDRVRLAMVLSVPNTAVSDDQRAADLLDPVVKNPNSSLHGLALLMNTHLQERRRLESGMQHLQQNVQGLQQKLDALMSLERTLIDREQATPPRKR